MTKNGEILKGIYDELISTPIPILTLPSGLVIEVRLDHQQATLLATQIFGGIFHLLTDGGSDPRGVRPVVPVTVPKPD